MEALPSARSAAQPGHFRGRSGFVDKDQPVRVSAHPGLAVRPPDSAVLDHVIAPGFGCQQCFF